MNQIGTGRRAGGMSEQEKRDSLCLVPRRDAAGPRNLCVMSNQLKDRFDEQSDRPSADDYFVVCAGYACYEVSTSTAAEVLRLLSRRWPPRWIGFVDLYGARVRIRSRLITMIHESTTMHRQRERDFERARTLEEKADRRPWEEDD